MPGPLPIETRDRGRVYDGRNDVWTDGSQSVFRPDSKLAPIDISSIGSHSIIPGVPGKSIRILSIFFTASAEVNVTLLEDSSALSGAMDFGASGEPRGISLAFQYSPVALGTGKGLNISLSAASQVSGAVCYFYQ